MGNDDVSKYLDGYDNLKLVNGEPVKEKITILNFLTMTSGLDYNLSRSAVTDLIANNPNASTIDICSKFASDVLIILKIMGF